MRNGEGQWSERRTLEPVHLVFVFRTGEIQLRRAKNEHQIQSTPVGTT